MLKISATSTTVDNRNKSLLSVKIIDCKNAPHFLSLYKLRQCFETNCMNWFEGLEFDLFKHLFDR